ncbi:MAG: hypothetical protein HY675_07660 [Chloroflexi bacterium]|nr:hypothetical protein [Chloroflexota bacterium]
MKVSTLASALFLAASLTFLAALSTTVLADEDTIPTTPASPTVSGQLLEKGAWVAYSFPYPGDGSEVRFGLDYAPADVGTDQGVVLTGYRPSDPPPNGKPIGTATQYSNFGGKHLSIGSSEAGTYTVLLQNWDAAGRPVQFTLTVSNVTTFSPGPALTFVSSGPPGATSLASAPTSPSPPSAETSPPAPSPAAQIPSAQPTAGASGQLPVLGAWAAYTFPYAGDGSEIRFVLNYAPSDPLIDPGIVLSAYSPSSPLPDGKPIGTATQSGNPAEKRLSIASTEPGTYTLFIQGWGNAGRPVQFDLTVINITTGAPGPSLTLIGLGP